MHVYSAFGLCLHSEFALPGLPAGQGEPDLVIRQAPLAISDLEVGPRGGDRITGHYEARLLVELVEGRRITVHPIRPISEDEIRGYVLGTLLAGALRQRGYHVLHGSCVARDGQALAFVGESGWGKSTLAEAFLQRGYAVLTDDLLVLDMRPEGAWVVPGPPYLRLRPEAGRALLDGHYDTLPSVSPLSNQRLHALSRGGETPVPLARIYLLDPEDAPRTAVEPLPPNEATLHLLVHSWGKQMFDDPAYRTRHFEHCVALVRGLPVQRLRRVRTLSALPEHIAAVEEDLRRGVEAPAGV